MEKIKTTLFIHKFIHKDYDSKPFVSSSDMRCHGYALLGTYEVEIPVPETDVIQAEVDALYEQASTIEADALEKARELKAMAEKLKESQHGN